MSQDLLKYKVFDWLRFPLIVFVVYIHGFGKPLDFSVIDFTNLHAIDFYNIFRISISHVLTHVAVPLFFFISGFLFFNKLGKWDFQVYFNKLKRRYKTIFVPFVIWNTIYIFIKLVSIVRRDGFESLFTHLEINSVFSLYWDCNVWNLDRTDWLGFVTPSSAPYLVPLWYLRDLMVVMVLSPFIFLLFKYTKYFGLVLLFICYISLIGIKVAGFSTTAFFFFGAGAFFNLYNIDPTIFLMKYNRIINVTAFLLWIIVTRYDGHYTFIGNYIYPFFIILGSLAMFNLASFMVKKKWLIPHILTQSSFFIYLSHPVKILGLCRYIADKVCWGNNPFLLSISYIVAPVLTITICVVCYCLLKRYVPKVCAIMTGER